MTSMQRADRLIATAIAFAHTGDGEHPYAAEVDGLTILVGVNDFPAEPLYSVYVDGQPLCDLDDWPAPWTKERIPQHLLDLVRDNPRAVQAIEQLDRADRTGPVAP